MISEFEELKKEGNYHKDNYGWEYIDIDERRQLQKDPSGKVSLYTSPTLDLPDRVLAAFDKACRDKYESSPLLSKRVKFLFK